MDQIPSFMTLYFPSVHSNGDEQGGRACNDGIQCKGLFINIIAVAVIVEAVVLFEVKCLFLGSRISVTMDFLPSPGRSTQTVIVLLAWLVRDDASCEDQSMLPWISLLGLCETR